MRQRAGGRVSLTFADGWATREVVADKVVLALPFSILRSSVDTSQAGFGPHKHTAIQSLGMGASARLHLQFDGRPWQAQAYHGRVGQRYRLSELLGRDAGPRRPGRDPGQPHRGAGGHRRRRRAAGRRRAFGQPGGDATGTPAGSSTRSRRCSRAPARWNGLAAYHDWSRYRWTLGSYAFYRPGQFTAFAGVEREPEGNCHFAGEHTSPDSSGMNGAVESGLRAAGEILDDLKP